MKFNELKKFLIDFPELANRPIKEVIEIINSNIIK